MRFVCILQGSRSMKFTNSAYRIYVFVAVIKISNDLTLEIRTGHLTHNIVCGSENKRGGGKVTRQDKELLVCISVLL